MTFLKVIENWIDEWQMRLNIKKIELLRIGRNNLSFPIKSKY